jgi:hypothetical protein
MTKVAFKGATTAFTMLANALWFIFVIIAAAKAKEPA